MSDQEMIDNVAKALAKQQYETTWNELPSYKRDEFYKNAKVAIEAMKEPTDKMIRCRGINYSNYLENKNCWQDMIVEILGT